MKTVETFFIAYLSDVLSVPVSGDVPENRPERFVTVEKLSSSEQDCIKNSRIAVQSWGESRTAAMLLNEEVKRAMAGAVLLPEISRCHCENDYNFPDLSSKTPRYQAIFEVVDFL